MMILNEELYAKNLLLGKNKDIRSAVKKISYITRYYFYVLHKSDSDNYSDTVEWMKKHQNNFEESCYSNVISNAIKEAKKRPFFNIDSIKIKKSELEIIKNLDNLREEKLLFVLLCMAKHQSAAYGYTDGLVSYSIIDLCKMARISVPADDREYILHKILTKGLIKCPKKNNTRCLWVNFIDNDGEDELVLSEIDCQELAYTYLKWRGKEKFKRCSNCGRLMSVRANNDICTICLTLSINSSKIWCIDCGEEVEVKLRDGQTCRCRDCQKKENIKATNRRVKRFRERKSM